MNRPTKKWTIHLIHHSHTDVGYTERQEKIERFHIGYIQQAIEISEAIRNGTKKSWEGFKWVCESFWPVEQFLNNSSKEWHSRFVAAVRAGHIELTGNYLHIVELLDQDIFSEFVNKSVTFAEKNGLQVTSSFTADLNGFGWGYAQALIDNGIENLAMCVHTHHGMFPVWRKQIPFWWETPKGDKLLVWNGDHYMLGNELGLVPKANNSYMIQDELSVPKTTAEHWELVEKRVNRYLSNLEKEEYPYDVVAVMASGLWTDNAPPNPEIAEFLHEWNEKFGEQIEIKMSSLTEFFSHLRQHADDIPTYRGDWPDWWNDGAFSTPMHTQMFREAQRKVRLVNTLNNGKTNETIEKAKQNIMMFSEHTWGHSASVSEPWNHMIHATAIRKEAYAAKAHEYASRALDEALEERGDTTLSYYRPLKYKVMNPHIEEWTDICELYVDMWDVPSLVDGFEVKQNGSVLPHQLVQDSRGTFVCVPLTLAANEETVLTIEPIVRSKEMTTLNVQRKGSDGVTDIQPTEWNVGEVTDGVFITESGIETPYVRIEWCAPEGIISWYDKTEKRELIDSTQEHSAFTPIYEVTPLTSSENMVTVRTKMGRNRKGMNVDRSVGQLRKVSNKDKGNLFSTVELVYEVAGTDQCSLFLKVYHAMNRVDVKLRMHKNSVWEPENMYLSLPFTISNDDRSDQLWLEKPGGILMKPYIDQLPGTNTDFYCIDEGIALTNSNYGLSIALPDTPLVQLGELAHTDRKLNSQDNAAEIPSLYIWLMTNYWETNFKATLGGFYEFTYSINWGKEMKSEQNAINCARGSNTGLLAIRLAE